MVPLLAVMVMLQSVRSLVEEAAVAAAGQTGGCGYAARNLALENGRARYVAFLDADDLWLPENSSALTGNRSVLSGLSGAIAIMHSNA